MRHLVVDGLTEALPCGSLSLVPAGWGRGELVLMGKIKLTALRTLVGAVTVGVLGAGAGPAVASAAPGYIAPHVAYSGAACVNLGSDRYRVTARYTATGGRYTDLGSYGRRTRVRVYGTSRTFYAVTTIIPWSFGGPTAPAGGAIKAPTLYMGSMTELTAPINWNGNYGNTHTISTRMSILPISCH